MSVTFDPSWRTLIATTHVIGLWYAIPIDYVLFEFVCFAYLLCSLVRKGGGEGG